MDTKKLLLFITIARSKGFSDGDITKFALMQTLANKKQLGEQMGGSQGQTEGGYQGEGVASSGNYPITQTFGQKSRYDVFSGGINTGVDYGVGEGTQVKVPQGKWIVEEAEGGVRGQGYIGNQANKGYGNSVLLKNSETGEKIRASHLANVKVKKGDEVKGGQVLGISGQTGNVTGPHLDAEYYNKLGALGDILKTAYGKQLL